MMTVIEIMRWLETLSSGSSVGVDEGGLTLREIDTSDSLTGATLEIGGFSEELEDQ